MRPSSVRFVRHDPLQKMPGVFVCIHPRPRRAGAGFQISGFLGVGSC